MRVLICGGGTGGHIYPALSVVDSLTEEGVTRDDVLWIGTQGALEQEVIPRAGLRLEAIPGGALVGKSWPVRAVNALKLTWALGKVNRIMSAFKPEVILMTGGYINLPVGIISWVRRIPMAIFLPDIEPALSVRTLSKLADRVACSVPDSTAFFPPGKALTTGYPVRSSLRRATTLKRKESLTRFGLADDRPTLFAFGGSRGARSINRALLAHIDDLLEKIQIIHVSGRLDWEEVLNSYDTLAPEKKNYYQPYPYLHEKMGAAYRAADLILARAGASMLGECPAFGVPAILVPYPYAWRYQKVNADYLVAGGAALRINDENLPFQLKDVILELIHDRRRLAEMSAAAKALDKPGAANRLAHLLLDMGREIVQ